MKSYVPEGFPVLTLIVAYYSYERSGQLRLRDFNFYQNVCKDIDEKENNW